MNEVQSRNQKIIVEFRENQRKVGGPFIYMPLLILHTMGAKSGEERLNPAAYLVDDDRYVIFASNGGRPNNPSWYHNVVANSQVTVEVGTEKFEATAIPVEEPERTELFDKMAAINAGFDKYPDMVTRVIPVVVITRMV